MITKSTTPLSEHDWHSKALAAVITVGDGRGFVVADGHNNLIVVTGAHCLPDLPPATPASYPEDRFYPNLLAPLGGTPSVACECLFADPVGDIALLGPPDVMSGELDAYYALIDDELVTPLRIEPPGDEGWLLSLDGTWFRCGIWAQQSGPLWLKLSEGASLELSGSPVISPTGAAVGVVCVSGKSPEGIIDTHGPNPSLIGNLPGWLLNAA